MKWCTLLAFALVANAVNASYLPKTYSLEKRATSCNGYEELCSRQYSNVTHIGAHDSFAVGKMGSLGSNQEQDVLTQLEDGIRVLQMQTHPAPDEGDESNPSGLRLCHTSCALKDGGTLESYLKDVRHFLDKNKNEVVTLIVTNPEHKSVNKFAKAFESTGLDKIAYTPNSESTPKDNWPTLKDMINKNQRLVVFLDQKADLSKSQYIIPEFDNIWENPYGQTTANFNCTPDRWHGDTDNKMYLINHFRDTELFTKKIRMPDTDNIEQTNSEKSILKDANSCASKHESYPTFVLVDFYAKGNGSVLKATAELNGVQYDGMPLAANEASGSDNKEHDAVGKLLVSMPAVVVVLTLSVLMMHA